jgi:hypothetical protein
VHWHLPALAAVSRVTDALTYHLVNGEPPPQMRTLLAVLSVEYILLGERGR